MAIRGKNMMSGAKLDVVRVPGNATAASNGSQGSSNPLSGAFRTSIQLLELGVTIMAGSAGTAITANAASVKWYLYNKGTATAIASLDIPLSTLVGTEYTSRDGTITWIGDYVNASSRVFPKGSFIGVEFDSGASGNTGNANDGFAFYSFAPEFGAPPA